MSGYSSTPRRTIGCLGRFLIILIVVLTLYWLFLSPISARQRSGPYTLDGKLDQTQQVIVKELSSASDGKVRVLAPEGNMQYIALNIAVPDSVAANPREKAFYFLDKNEALFQFIGLTKNIKFESITSDVSGNAFVQFSQQYQGIPVHGSSFIVSVSKSDVIYAINSIYDPTIKLNVQPSVQKNRAELVALNDLNFADGRLAAPSTLEIRSPIIQGDLSQREPARLVWFVTVQSTGESQLLQYAIDAQQGVIIEKVNLKLEAGFHLRIQEQNGTNTYPVYTENGPVNPAVTPSLFSENSLNNSRAIYAYYFDTFGRDSYDDKGGLIDIRVNISNCSDTAYWTPTLHYIYFCQGWTLPFDVIAHEFTHAVIQKTVNFSGGGEPRELNEAFADLFAAFSDRTGTPWQVNGSDDLEGGSTIIRNIGDPIEGYPLRYQDRYCDRNNLFCSRKCPDRIGPYTESYSDCGHFNSIVFSHAGFLMSREGNQTDGIQREKLQHLYYYVLKNKNLGMFAGQKAAAQTVLTSCLNNIDKSQMISGKELPSPFSEKECEQVQKAFVSAGLIVQPVTIPVDQWLEFLDKLTTDIRLKLRDQLDHLIGDIRARLEDEIQKLIAQAQQELMKGMQNLLLWLFSKLVEELQMLANQCCGGVMPLVLLPAGYSFYLKRIKSRSVFDFKRIKESER